MGDTLRIMDEPKTICAKCKHRANKGVGGELNWWYQRRCGVVSRPAMLDPVTGAEGWKVTNDLGQVCFSYEEYPHCQDKNHGNCPDYEAE